MTPAPHGDGVLSVALAHHLASLGLVKYPATSGEGEALPAYCNNMPDSPDEAVGIFDQPGPASVDVLGYVTPEVHVVVRGEVAGQDRVPRELAQRIRVALHDTAHTVWGVGTADEVLILTCDAMDSAPAPLRHDRDRPRWSVRYKTEYQED